MPESQRELTALPNEVTPQLELVKDLKRSVQRVCCAIALSCAGLMTMSGKNACDQAPKPISTASTSNKYTPLPKEMMHQLPPTDIINLSSADIIGTPFTVACMIGNEIKHIPVHITRDPHTNILLFEVNGNTYTNDNEISLNDLPLVELPTWCTFPVQVSTKVNRIACTPGMRIRLESDSYPMEPIVSIETMRGVIYHLVEQEDSSAYQYAIPIFYNIGKDCYSGDAKFTRVGLQAVAQH